MSIQTNLKNIRLRIKQCEQQFQRQPNSVFLLAASKGQSIEKIEQAIAAGQYAFGENYLQEALTKIAALSKKNLAWHFIGLVQRNKTHKIAEHFSWVHSVNSTLIAKRLDAQRPDHLPPLNICIEVNVSSEPTKSGARFDEVIDLAQYCIQLPRLKLRGLMAIPAYKSHFIEQRAEFYKLRLIDEMLRNDKYSLDTLSMGMSHDMDAAIAEGTTIVRIGTSIFGPRI
jgi:pyridoxal phosphate enzyme (YggS family)